MSEVENHVDVVKIDFKSSNFWPSNIFNLKSNSKLFSKISPKPGHFCQIRLKIFVNKMIWY